MKIKKTDLAYIAGLIDGEGCIQIRRGIRKRTKHGYPRYQLKITVSNTVVSPLKFCESKLGGKVKRVPPGKRSNFERYTWRAVNLIETLNRVIPYLIIKKKQALFGLKFQKLLSANKSYETLSEKNQIQRKNMYLRMKLLKNYGRKELAK